MDAYLVLWWLVFVLLILLDSVLWALALVLPLHGETRFRCLSAAVVVTYVIVGMLFGFVVATVLVSIGLWVYAILVGSSRSLTVE